MQFLFLVFFFFFGMKLFLVFYAYEHVLLYEVDIVNLLVFNEFHQL